MLKYLPEFCGPYTCNLLQRSFQVPRDPQSITKDNYELIAGSLQYTIKTKYVGKLGTSECIAILDSQGSLISLNGYLHSGLQGPIYCGLQGPT